MATFRARVPSYQENALVFAACAFVVYNWSLYQFIKQVPGWLYFLNVWEVLGILAYSQLFALLESVLLLGSLWLLALVVPAHLFRERFVAVGVLAVLVTSIWAILAQFNDELLREASPLRLLLWLSVYFISLGAVYFLVRRFVLLQNLAYSIAERLTILLYIYVPVGLLALILVVLRNL